MRFIFLNHFAVYAQFLDPVKEALAKPTGVNKPQNINKEKGDQIYIREATKSIFVNTRTHTRTLSPISIIKLRIKFSSI